MIQAFYQSKSLIFAGMLLLCVMASFAVHAQDAPIPKEKPAIEEAAPAEEVPAGEPTQVQQILGQLKDANIRPGLVEEVEKLVGGPDTPEGETPAEDMSLPLEEEKPEKAPVPAISQVLDIEGGTEELAHIYEDFLTMTGFRETNVGRITLSVSLLIFFMGLKLLLDMGTYRLRRRVIRFQRRLKLRHTRFSTYIRIARYGLYLVLFCLFVFGISVIWDVTEFGWIKTDLSITILSNFFRFAALAALTIGVWEGINGFLEYWLHRAEDANENRLKTLLPLIRHILFIIFLVLFILAGLSELGVNIFALLAGAGIIGIAIGFGAQTILKDMMTGITILMEDLIQIGDLVKIGGCEGYVEKITLRKVQLRDTGGTVYTVPYSEISIVENQCKDFSTYLMDIGVAYRENTDEVVAALREVDKEMRNDEKFGPMILAPLDVLGVEKFDDSAVVIRVRTRTLPVKHLPVGREFNRRIKLKFDELGIEIPFPHQTLYFGEDKQGMAPPLRAVVQNVG